LKILFLNPVGNIGGAERSLLELLSTLKKERPQWQLKVICGDHGPLIESLQTLGVDVSVHRFPLEISTFGDSHLNDNGLFSKIFKFIVALPLLSFNLIKYLKIFKNILKVEEPDIIHSNGLKFHFISGIIKNDSGKLIWHARDYLSNRKLASILLRNFCNSPNMVIANSMSVLQDWKKIIPKTKFDVLYNSVFVEDAANYSNIRTSPLGQRILGECRVGLVASYAKWKGHEVFLKAINLLISDPVLDKTIFFIVGGPIYKTSGSQWSRDELEFLANKLGIAKRVHFVCHQNDMGPIYRDLDIVVHASTSPEPFGRTIIESMSFEKPIIASMAGGVVEIIEDGLDGVGYQPGNAGELAEKIKLLVIDQNLRKGIGLAGLRKVLRKFDRKVIKDQICDIYEGLMEVKPC